MTSNVITLERQDGLAIVTLNRPEKRNAMNVAMMDALTEAAGSLAQDDRVYAVFLRGAGDAFCAGGDLGWMGDQMAADRAGKIQEARRLSGMLEALNAMAKPLVTYAHGSVFGGGLGLLAVSDIVCLNENASLSFSETKLGLIPATIGPFVLRKIGQSHARDLFLSAEVFDAERAKHINLIHHIVDAEAEALAKAQALKTNAASAMEAAKRALAQMQAGSLKDDIEISINALADIWESEDAQTRISAFLNKGRKT